jgi:hypothetical protein
VRSGFRLSRVLAEPAENQSYAWSGEVLMYEEKAKTVTVIGTHARRTQAIARIVIGG